MGIILEQGYRSLLKFFWHYFKTTQHFSEIISAFILHAQ